MTIERLTYDEADIETAPYLGSAKLAFAANKKRLDDLRRRGLTFMPWAEGPYANGHISRFHSYEEANAHQDDMIARRVRMIKEGYPNDEK